MRPPVLFAAIATVLMLTSCATRYHVKTEGMARVRYYRFAHKDVPLEFDGVSVVFASDFHYKSKFGDKRLRGTMATIERIAPDILMLGGDYKEGCGNIPALFDALGSLDVPLGKYAVMGNNDYEECYDEIADAMSRNGIRLLEHECDTIARAGGRIIVAGVRNPFDPANLSSPTAGLSDDDFVILLVHTPDYAQDTDIAHTDLVLSGHTHGGQVTLFGYAPVIPSKYGQRFRTGLKHNDDGIPVIITNGLGTSRRNVRAFAPSEIVVIELRHADED